MTHTTFAARSASTAARFGLAALLGLAFVAPAAADSVGIASFYGGGHHGGPTASGERFNMYALTAAHRTARLGSSMRVTNLANGKSVVVRINDRGPFVRGRVIDLSRAAAAQLGFIGSGLAKVRLEPMGGGEEKYASR